jgi:hypothetical protein
MRLAFAASVLSLGALGLGILALADQPAAPQAPAPAATAAAPTAAPPTPTRPASTAPASASATVPGDAAARHVKRRACLKEAKTKKLIGAEKTAFLKDCIDAPAEPISASRHMLPDRP